MLDSAEIERRREICGECSEYRSRHKGMVHFCARNSRRPDGVYCEPWAAREHAKRLVAVESSCEKWKLPDSNGLASPMPPVTATITMCRRLKLMCGMMDSLLQCVIDHSHISRWIAIDDGSASSDLYQIAECYPFVEIVVNDIKGHPAALNQLFGMVETDYIFHLEDDWRFETPGPILQHCWTVMQHNPRVGVVCLRGFHFGDIPAGDGISYGLHSHGPGSPWPGYSLNPGLQDLRKVRDTGPFVDEPNFEHKYAKRFRDMGYELAHLNPPSDRRWITHTGGGHSAYAANGTSK